jgi:hypothetical protein
MRGQMLISSNEEVERCLIEFVDVVGWGILIILSSWLDIIERVESMLMGHTYKKNMNVVVLRKLEQIMSEWGGN